MKVSPWTGIFLITFAFQLFRKELVDSLIFGLATVVMLLQPVWHVSKRTFPLVTLGKRYLWGTVSGFILLATYIPRSHPLLAIFFIFLALLLFLSLWGVPEHAIPRSPNHVRSVFIWSALALGIALWELTALVLARLSGDDERYPTISELVVPSLDSVPSRLTFACSWMLIGFLVLRHWRAR